MDVMQIVVEGSLQPDGTLVLDEKPNLPPGRVRVTMQAVPPPADPEDGFMVRMEKIWAAQKARGHVPRTREEIDNSLRDDAEEERQALERLHEKCVRAREQASSQQELGQ